MGVHILLVDWYLNYCFPITFKWFIDKCFWITLFGFFVYHKAWLNYPNPDNNLYRSSHNEEPLNHDVYVSNDITDQVFPIYDTELVFWIGE